ncbi:hypothetical protein B0F90DRAFT_1621691, partial [Multifurca ochricompacta]
GHHGWIHWFTYPVPDGGAPNMDYWPDTSQYSPEELFAAPGFKHKDGKQAYLFSSRNPKTVQKHFHWMAENGVDGVFLQRFLGLCDIASGGNDGNRRIRDEVGDHVQRAAEREGRVYAIMYDVTGVQPDRVQEIIEADWYHLLQEKRVLNSPNYLREDGKPVIAIWGLGFKDSKHTPAQVRALTFFFRNSTPGGAYLVAGTPAHWRTSDSDADSNPEFVTAWMQSFDAISPWTVGRYSDQSSADAFAEDRIQGDVMFIADWTMKRGRRVEYIPVVHPGGSGFNLSNGHWARNGVPREGGRFLWRQIYNARKWGVRTIYGAMWDEYDEGTQFLPAITKNSDLPHDANNKFTLIAYDVDGYDVPSDWYMRIAGYGSELLKRERHLEDRFPEKELRDWDHSHPKIEVRPSLASLLASGSRSGGAGGDGQSYEDWLKTTDKAKDKEEAPPPPYSLEAEGTPGVQTVTTQGAAPPVPLSSRPTSLATSFQSPASLEHRLSLATHHNQAPAPSRLSPIQSSYPGQKVTVPQPPSQYQQHDPIGPSSYTRPTVQLPMPNHSPLPQPASLWSPQATVQPAWPPRDWNEPPHSFPPTHFPVPPGQSSSSYGYFSGYNEPVTFPEAAHPSGPGDYGFAMPQAAPILESQQLNPGPPPPPLQSREFRSSASSGDHRTSILNDWPDINGYTRPQQQPTRTRSAAAAVATRQYTALPAVDTPYLKPSFPTPWGLSTPADAHAPERVAFPTPNTGAGLTRTRTEPRKRHG